ncbi:hypothetical protein Cgig2_031238 [Carnegiea gigantea]|uniref:AMP-activated protein kinase glycogen-binding domain-containing protein n=1 Tax=Carnegiea gigantea TaxID=171969 RepID=A0A9Q1QMD9_9CARY|nr:hypothetical protein Cgig2_031238 [Carnegiea gigantea]
MVSLIAASSARFTVSHKPISYLNPPRFFPIVFVISPPKRQYPLHPRGKHVRHKKQNQLLFEFSDSFEVARMCRRWEGGGDPALELEVLELMKNSKNPDKFPSKRELIEAGRGDLVEAILKRGGWMSIGWEDDKPEGDKIEGELARNLEFEFETNGENVCEGEGRSGSDSELNGGKIPEGISFLGNSSPAASSSGRSLEMAVECESGIEGILKRLERQRLLSFGLHMRRNGGINHESRNLDKDEQSGGVSKDVDSCHSERNRLVSLGDDGSLFRSNGLSGSRSDLSSSSLQSDTCRTWGIHRAGSSDTEFEAAEINFGGKANLRRRDKCEGDEIVATTDIEEPVEQREDFESCVEQITQGDVKTRLRHLEAELSSALGSLRSNTANLSEKVNGHLSEDLRQLSDASEFQETEIMHAQSKLRSLRAKLAILDGKMALAIIDAQKILDEKQKRINDARRAVQLLQTTCVVWPNAGSEVLLAGSFDGWATQRTMERSSTGIFSLQLKLYPGRYEIKFIVDGSWRVDPHRPIVNNNGFENNLLIIT